MSGHDRHPAVGLFGGTFDPVHLAHLQLVRHVLSHCRLDRVLLIPALQPPHKQQPAASYEDRAAMLELALAGEERMRCSRVEASLPIPSYTVHTIEALQKAHPASNYFFIIGEDSLADLPCWYRADALLDMVNLIVVRRPTQASAGIAGLMASLGHHYLLDATSGSWRNERGRTIQYLADLELPVSSSQLRQALARGERPTMLPPVVLAYISEHHLYGFQEH